MSLVFYKIDIDYVDNILSLNLNKIFKVTSIGSEANIEKDGTIKYDDYMFNIP